MLAGLGAPMKAHMARHHTVGTSNTASYNYRRWQAAMIISDASLSNTFMASKAVTAVQRRHTLRYRFGVLFTASLAHLYRYKVSPACPLCGAKVDNAHHSVSGCPALSASVTARHNRAGCMLVDAILAGSMGATLLFTDFGRDACVSLPDCRRRIPPYLLPDACTSPPSIPDAIMLVPPACAPSLGKRTRGHNSRSRDSPIASASPSAAPSDTPLLLILELKFCCDTSQAHQMHAAMTQHTALINLFQLRGYRTQLVPLLFGVAGTIFTDTLRSLHADLGISKSAARQLCKDVHLHAVRSLSSIYMTKRFLNHQHASASTDNA
jgi:hypothetical protein